ASTMNESVLTHTAGVHVPASSQFRRETRAPHRVQCFLVVPETKNRDALSYPAQTTNISKSGISVQVARAIPKGQLVKAVVPSAGGKEMSLEGIVVHSRQVMADTYELGILIQPPGEVS
ncbi:MAG: PilZ domain-containing protein, partial [Phycisphaerae bacterium]